MLNDNFTITPECFSETDFPEFYPNFVDCVVSELNQVLQKSLHEPIPSGASLDEVFHCLREDVLKHPGLYLSDGLLSKIDKRNV